MTKKKKQYTVHVTDSDGNTLMIEKIDERDFHLEMNNDLLDSPNFIGNFLPARLVSRGWSFNITGYVRNKDYSKDMEQAVDDNYKGRM